MDNFILEMNTNQQNESYSLISKNSNGGNTIKKYILYKKWWSSFYHLNSPWIHWVLLTISFLSMMYQLLEIPFWEKFDIMAHIFGIHRIFVSIVIFTSCCYVKYYKLFEYLYEILYKEGDISTNNLDKSSYRDSFILFILNIHYSWIDPFILSAFFSIIVPWIHPDMKQEFSLYRVSGKKLNVYHFKKLLDLQNKSMKLRLKLIIDIYSYRNLNSN
jgi:hypothetical protein